MLMKCWIFVVLVLLGLTTKAQRREGALKDTLRPKPARLYTNTGLHVSAYSGTLILLNQAWYKDYPKQSFHTFNDSKEWKQVDKVGHGWTAYSLSRASAASWKWAGLNEKQAAWAGAGSGFAFMTVIEFLDAHSAEWGWSWSDVAANTLGSGLFLSQQLAWQEQRIHLKYSFHGMDYKDPMLELRANKLFGSSWYERMLKDYNGQTYWLSANLKSFAKNSQLPPWLNLSIGYGAGGLFGGFENLAKDANGNITFDRRDVPRVRQFYLSPDIDFTRIKTNKKWVRSVLFCLNALKMPAPALMLNSKGQFRAYWMYF